MKKVVILTGSGLRHVYFRMFLAQSENICVINSYCEGTEDNLHDLVQKEKVNNDIRLKHLLAREQAEEDFFRLFVDETHDHSKPIFLPKGRINEVKYVDSIIKSKPDLILVYGSSIIREPLLGLYEGKILNVHLGISPYYRGGATNYWPLVNGEPEYVGATFMYIDAGIDTGEIIHQIRAKYSWGDTPSQIGNRLIVEMSKIYIKVVESFDGLVRMPQFPKSSKDRIYRRKDYTEESVRKLYRNFNNGMVEKYIDSKDERCAKVPILTNPALVLKQ